MHKRVKRLLRLLHPDFTINQPLKGGKKHARIEAAFKKLNGLRYADEQKPPSAAGAAQRQRRSA